MKKWGTPSVMTTMSADTDLSTKLADQSDLLMSFWTNVDPCHFFCATADQSDLLTAHRAITCFAINAFSLTRLFVGRLSWSRERYIPGVS